MRRLGLINQTMKYVGAAVISVGILSMSFGCAGSKPIPSPPPPAPRPEQAVTPPQPIPKAEPKPPYLVLHPLEHLSDETVFSARIGTRSLGRVMILPSSGTAGEAFNDEFTSIEQAFMRRGIPLVSPAVGARAIALVPAPPLSDLERALVLGKQGNAGAVLQIGTFMFTSQGPTITNSPGPERGARYIVYNDMKNSVSEVSAEVYEIAQERFRFKFLAPVFLFKAKLIDVSDGSILAVYSFTGEISKALPQPYTAQLTSITAPQLRSTNFDWSDADWVNDARARIVSEVYNEIAASLK